MKVEDFAPFYGVEVMLQLKEPIALGVASGAPRQVPCFTKEGKPANAAGQAVDPKVNPGDIAPQTTWPIGPQRDGEGKESKVVFTYIIEGVVLLAKVEEEEELDLEPPAPRLVVSYKRGTTLLELLIEPELILACTAVRAHAEPEQQRLIARA